MQGKSSQFYWDFGKAAGIAIIENAQAIRSYLL
jgi:hypothetical protein